MRTENTSLRFTIPGLDVVVQLYQKNVKTFYDKFTVTTTLNGPRGYYQVATEGDFLPASEVNQAEGIDFQDFQTPYYMNLTPRKRAIGFSIATEDLTTDLYGLLAKRGTKMMRAITKSKEYDAADFINLGTTTAVPTPDGLAFFSAAHLYQLGTYSNILTNNLPLSYLALEQAKQELFTQPSHTGDPMAFAGDMTLLVHPSNMGLANRLCSADRMPTTNDNDKNWGGQNVTPLANPYFSSTTAWALVMSDKSVNPMKMISRRGLKTDEQPDISRDAMLYTATEIWIKGAFDPRGIIYSAGA